MQSKQPDISYYEISKIASHAEFKYTLLSAFAEKRFCVSFKSRIAPYGLRPRPLHLCSLKVYYSNDLG